MQIFTTTGVNILEFLILFLNESKANLGLLQKSGITAYEMSKNAGVPPPEIHVSLSKLLMKGLIGLCG